MFLLRRHLGVLNQFLLGGLVVVFLPAAIGFATGTTGDSGNARTIFSRVNIPDDCHASYERGVKSFEQAHQSGVMALESDQQEKFFDGELASEQEIATEDCTFFFSMGLFDAQGMLQQNLVLEYFLELQTIEDNPEWTDKPFVRNSRMASIQNLFAERFRLAGLQPEQATLLRDKQDRRQVTDLYLKQLRAIAKSENSAVPFGRFLIVELETLLPLTQFEYVWTTEHKIDAGRDGQLPLRKGSYQILANKILQDAYDIARTYVSWQPGMIFGEDSFFYGAFWRWWRADPEEKSIREIKENHFFSSIRRLNQVARSIHMKMGALRDIESHMVRKQKAYLDRDIAVLNKVKVGLMAAPLIPVGMALGTAGLVHAGVTALPAGASSVYLGSSSLAYASNISAAISFGTITSFAGLGAYSAIREYRARADENLPFHIADAFDHIIGSAIASFPLAAALPAAVGGVGAGTKTLSLAARSVIADGMSWYRAVKGLGWQGTWSAAKQLPWQLTRSWATTWWKNRKTLMIHYVVDLSISMVFEVGYRQYFREGDEKFTWLDGDGVRHFNDNAMYTLGSTVIIGAISKPMLYIPTLAARWLTWRAIGITGSIMAQLALKGELDSDMITFSESYGAVAGSALGEWERKVKLSSFIQKRSTAQQYAILLLIRMVVKTAETPLRVSLMEAYLGEGISPAQTVRESIKKWVAIDIDDMSDEVIEGALLDLQADPDFQEQLRIYETQIAE